MTNSSIIQASQYSPWSFLLFAVAVSAFAYDSIHEQVNLGTEYTLTSSWILGFFNCFSRTVGALFIWVIWFLKVPPKNGKVQVPWLYVFQNSYPILLVLSLALRTISEVANGQCYGNIQDVQILYPCNNFQEQKIIPPSNLLMLMFLPLVSFFLIRETRPESIAIAWIISLGTIIGCSIYMWSEQLLVPIFVYIFASLLMFYDSDRQNNDMLRIITALRTTLIENEKLQVEAQAIELRAMIGNVAHDLKTPLTSILSGIELIKEIINGWEVTLASTELVNHPFLIKSQENSRTVKSCLNGMMGANSFMTMCINRCLDYTKASKGVKLVPKNETVILAEALDFPATIMQEIQNQTEIKYHPVASNICTHIMTDKQWLVENLLCLLSNAVKYSNSGVVEVKVQLIPEAVDCFDLDEAPSRFLRFEVQDSGIGLSEEAMANLFAPFKQAQRLAGGTGLGLFSLAKRVEALQGQYGVSKRPDGLQGSLFWFTIPYRPDDLSAAQIMNRSPSSESGSGGEAPCNNMFSDLSIVTSSANSTPTTPSASMSPRGRSLKVLAVDDAPTILKMTSMLLTKKGHHVDKAVNGAEALEMLLMLYERRSYHDLHAASTSTSTEDNDGHHSLYDVVLMDLQMPIMDGIEAIRRLRAAEKEKETLYAARRVKEDSTYALSPQQVDIESGNMGGFGVMRRPEERYHQFIIALSANSDHETMQEALSAGADEFIGKPFAHDTFANVMQKRGINVMF